MKTTDHDTRRERELRRWPGVTVAAIDRTGKHRKIVLAFDGRTRFVVAPNSTGDSAHGPKRHVQDIRKVCRELGAKEHG